MGYGSLGVEWTYLYGMKLSLLPLPPLLPPDPARPGSDRFARALITFTDDSVTTASGYREGERTGRPGKKQ